MVGSSSGTAKYWALSFPNWSNSTGTGGCMVPRLSNSLAGFLFFGWTRRFSPAIRLWTWITDGKSGNPSAAHLACLLVEVKILRARPLALYLVVPLFWPISAFHDQVRKRSGTSMMSGAASWKKMACCIPPGTWRIVGSSGT